MFSCVLFYIIRRPGYTGPVAFMGYAWLFIERSIRHQTYHMTLQLYLRDTGEFVRMRRAVMAFWSDKSLPKAAETTIANSVSPLAPSAVHCRGLSYKMCR